MNIYLINRQIEELLEEVDPETGEALFDPALLNELMMERENATEDLALGYKNLTAEASAIRGEAAVPYGYDSGRFSTGIKDQVIL